MKFVALMLSVLTWCMPCLAQTTEPAPQVPDHMQLFLLVGQSNMAGRGKVNDADKVPNPRIFMLNKEMQWVPARDPVHFDKPGIAGVGLSSEFARTIAAKNPQTTIGLIPCAFGGTSLDQWKKDSDLYTTAIKRAREAMKKGTLSAILWHQGEADCSGANAATYVSRFTTMMTSMREDLGAQQVPVIVGELGHFFKPQKLINDVLPQIPSKLNRCALVSAEGLVDGGDKVHFDSASLKIFGQRYAEAYEKLAAAEK